MNEMEIAKRLYNKIETTLCNKKITQYKLSEEIGIADSTLSDQLKKLKNGKLISLKALLLIQEKIGAELIFFAN